jgi:hypothetical protein
VWKWRRGEIDDLAIHTLCLSAARALKPTQDQQIGMESKRKPIYKKT